MLLVFFDFVALATLPDLLILDTPLLPLDLLEEGPFFYETFLVIFEDFIYDLADLDACDFFPLVLRLKTVPLSSYISSYS
jgi:hypothetical protein